MKLKEPIPSELKEEKEELKQLWVTVLSAYATLAVYLFIEYGADGVKSIAIVLFIPIYFTIITIVKIAPFYLVMKFFLWLCCICIRMDDLKLATSRAWNKNLFRRK